MATAYPMLVERIIQLGGDAFSLLGRRSPEYVLRRVDVRRDTSIASGVTGTRTGTAAVVDASSSVFDALAAVLAAAKSNPATPAMVIVWCEGDVVVGFDAYNVTLPAKAAVKALTAAVQ